mmetsp:Transcript_40330/g.97313  ORF Transcript_40330/g.97313 Transcript_40330/m.97313 type:complete len:205 (-) Transcript_40330:17-631(-)
MALHQHFSLFIADVNSCTVVFESHLLTLDHVVRLFFQLVPQHANFCLSLRQQVARNSSHLLLMPDRDSAFLPALLKIGNDVQFASHRRLLNHLHFLFVFFCEILLFLSPLFFEPRLQLVVCLALGHCRLCLHPCHINLMLLQHRCACLVIHIHRHNLFQLCLPLSTRQVGNVLCLLSGLLHLDVSLLLDGLQHSRFVQFVAHRH